MILGSGLTCHWIRPVAAPCNVTRSSGIMTLYSPGGSTLQCGRWLWDDMPFHYIRPNVCHIGILHLVSISTTSPRSTCHSAPVSEILSKSDYPQQKKWRHVDFKDGGFQPSWIFWSNNGSFEKPNYITSYRSSIENIAKCLVFEKIAFFHFGVMIQDGGSPPSWSLGIQ